MTADELDEAWAGLIAPTTSGALAGRVPPHTDPDDAHATMMAAAAPNNAATVDGPPLPHAG